MPGGFFYNLGMLTGPAMRKGKWVFKSLTGDNAEAVAAETGVGRDLALALGAEVKLDESTFTEHRQWLDDLGQALADRITNKNRTFSFKIIEADDPNAFALPGGFIFISRSLLDLCKWNRDEIAFVLGHEMGHVVKGHAMDRIMNNAAITAASRAIPGAGVLAGWIKSVGVRFLHTAYSREAEFEADEFGARIAAATGLNPHGGTRLLQRLAQLEADDFPLGEYFSSHPPTDLRIEKLDKLIKD